jgi:hypothetical protein
LLAAIDMATLTNEKASQPAPSSPLADDTTPIALSSKTDDEKHVREMNLELSRQSSLVSAPSGVHQANPFDTDIEAAAHPSDENLNRKSTTLTKPNQECPVWPGQNHWKQKARAAKIKNRSCSCMAHLSKRTRLIIKIAILLLIVGVAVGVGLGISKTLGTGVYHQ